jgi:hypothetical protein
VKNEFIKPHEVADEMTETYELTDTGKIACNINEIHPLIASNMILKWELVSEFWPNS